MPLLTLRKMAASGFVLFAVSLLAFGMIHLAPGDPISIMLREHATPQLVARLRHQLGLDQPLYEQYWSFVSGAVQGDLGQSIRSGQPVVEEIAYRLGSTVQLTVAAMVITVPLGIGLGVLAAVTRSRLVNFLVMSFALVGLSMPEFWSGLLLILVFGLMLDLLPVVSEGGISALILPAITLALPASAVLARMTRANMLDVFGQNYVRTARAKGLAERVVVFRHALKNAFIPVLTIISLQLGGLLAGTVIVESVFSRPGVGRLAVQAILARDFPVVQGVVLLTGTVFVVINLLTDLLYPLVDPRMRVGS